ncbi:hypothetical protein G4Z16_18905 [Streptomyces bathyalis]|uniref:Integral membrane protein n=1 Tax=Streptomyces bathyalis TaxID=2710756 RepID=A0A7T1WTF1_9ACTN|nr:hypothetical protein [Streptomyces bathyalis]QPP08127.1 hypothetical protein G4Z16_18905 [Streptomyces bathyalis]
MASTQYSGAAATAGVPASDGLARLALKLDGVVTGLNGIGYLALATVLDSLLGIETSVQYPIGAFLLVYAIGVLAAGTRPSMNKNALGAVIAVNFLWAVASIVTLFSFLSPTLAGEVWIVLQALVVGLFAGLQYIGLKRM